MKRPNSKPMSARSLKVSLLATLGVYMALSSSHWTTPDIGRQDLLSQGSEMAGISDDARFTNRPAASTNPARAAEVAGLEDGLINPNSRLQLTETASANISPAEDATGALNQSETDMIIEICEKKFNATQDDKSYTFTEVMETNCTDCVVTSYRVAIQAENIAQTLAEIAMNNLSDEVCDAHTAGAANPELQASNAEVVEDNQGEETQEENLEESLTAWEQCGEQEDDISALQCYADVLDEKRGATFIDEILGDLGDDPTHIQFVNAVKVRMNDVNRLLEDLVKTDDELVAGQIGEISRLISESLDKIFHNRKFTRLNRRNSVSASMANLVNRSIETLVASYQSWARKGDFRVQELGVKGQTDALTAQSELLRRQMVGINPQSAQLLRGFMTSYMNTTSNPRYFMDGFYRMRMDQGFHVQLMMLQNLDPSAAALAYQWQTLAQEGITIRGELGSNFQQIIQSESNPSARAAMLSSYNNVLESINGSFDLTRSDLYDPYFMSLELLNLRAGSDAGRTEDTQFHVQPVVVDTVSTLPGNSQYQGTLDDMLNTRTTGVGTTTTPESTIRPGVGRVSY